MHLVIHDMSGLPEVDRVDDFVVPILFVAVQILRLPAVTGVVEEERVVRPRIFYQPVHGSQDVLLRGLTHRVVLIICQAHHVLSLVAEVSVQVGGHVLHVVDTSSQLTTLTKVIDTDQQSFPSTAAVRVLKCVSVGRAVSCNEC